MGQPKSGIFRTADDDAPKALLLLLDDDADFRAALTRLLRSHGYQTVDAIGAADAFSHCANGKPELVICSEEMPLLDGAAVAEMIHRALGVEAPSVFIVTSGDESLVPTTYAAGVISRSDGPHAALERLMEHQFAVTYDEAVGK